MSRIHEQGERLALSWLRSPIANLKTLAFEMGITPRALQRWRNGEYSIPRKPIKQILLIARSQVGEIEELKRETDAYLLSFKDPGNFKASAKVYLESTTYFEIGGAQ